MEIEFNENKREVSFWADSKSPIAESEVFREDFVRMFLAYDELKTQYKELEHNSKKKTKSLLISLLEVSDNLERVLNKTEKSKRPKDDEFEKYLKSFRLVKKMVDGILKEEGVVAIDAPDGRAIPGYHTVIATEEREGVREDTIITEMVRGFLWKNDILRKSEVVVVKNY